MSAGGLEARGLTRRFTTGGRITGRGRAIVHAVEDVSLRVAAGEAVGLVGESGSGKTTLARMLVRLQEPTAGAVLLDGADVTRRGRRALMPFRRAVQIVFQDPMDALNPRLTVGRIVREPLDIHRVPGDRDAIVAGLLERVGLSAADAGAHPHRFSGGQRQRIGIARALALSPRFLVLDEPVSALDVSVQAQILALLDDLRRERGLGYLVVSHDLAVVRAVTDRVLVMYAGRIVESGPTEDVLAAPAHPYTAALVAAAPGARRDPAAAALDGEPPSPLEPPAGCAFLARCPVARAGGGDLAAACAAAVPAAVDLGHGRRAACLRPRVPARA